MFEPNLNALREQAMRNCDVWRSVRGRDYLVYPGSSGSAYDREVRQGSGGREGRRAVSWGLGAHGKHCTLDLSLRVVGRCGGGSKKGSNMISLILKKKIPLVSTQIESRGQ